MDISCKAIEFKVNIRSIVSSARTGRPTIEIQNFGFDTSADRSASIGRIMVEIYIWCKLGTTVCEPKFAVGMKFPRYKLSAAARKQKNKYDSPFTLHKGRRRRAALA